MRPFRERLARPGVLLCDGAMGTLLLQRGLKAGECPERMNLERPEVLEEIARSYAGRELTILGLMKGSLVFMADLVRKLPLDLTVHLVRVTSQREQAAGRVLTEIVFSTSVPLEGRDVLLVADCVPVAHPDFHRRFLDGRPVLMGCPKLDHAAAHIQKPAQLNAR